MSIVDELKAEAAKFLAEAEKIEHGVKEAVVDAFAPAEKDVQAEVAKVEPEVAKVETEVKVEAAAVETKAEAVVAVVKAPVAQFKGKKVMGVQYAADGLTVEWKG